MVKGNWNQAEVENISRLVSEKTISQITHDDDDYNFFIVFSDGSKLFVEYDRIYRWTLYAGDETPERVKDDGEDGG